uniref:HDC07387 n=1 Tax=Drosophila melanogaster TaxID=7227 RepID=Q6IG32_DROME|nr:TPA_inf: HDC07387 [Drosophila melanogaster]
MCEQGVQQRNFPLWETLTSSGSCPAVFSPSKEPHPPPSPWLFHLSTRSVPPVST